MTMGVLRQNKGKRVETTKMAEGKKQGRKVFASPPRTKARNTWISQAELELEGWPCGHAKSDATPSSHGSGRRLPPDVPGP